MKALVLVLLSACAAVSVAQAQGSHAAAATTVAAKGRMMLAANGARLGAVYRVTSDGSAQLILDGRLVTIPAATLSNTDGKLVTSLSKSEISDLP